MNKIHDFNLLIFASQNIIKINWRYFVLPRVGAVDSQERKETSYRAIFEMYTLDTTHAGEWISKQEVQHSESLSSPGPNCMEVNSKLLFDLIEKILIGRE